MGKTFLGNPYGIESEWEDEDDFTFIIEEGPAEFETFESSVDADSDEDEEFVLTPFEGNEPAWMDDISYVSGTTDSDTNEDDDDMDDDVDDEDEVIKVLETISNIKTRIDTENSSTDPEPPEQESPTE